MDRDFTPDIRENEPAVERTPEREVRPKEHREARDRYSLTDRQRETIGDIGKFRTIALEDLSNQRYGGKGADLREDMRALLSQGLVQKRTALVDKGRHKLTVVVLTKAGKRVAESSRLNKDQAVYSGFVKPGEVAHDAAIFRMFHKEAGKIEGDGGTIKRIVLDYELKKSIFSPLAKARQLPTQQYARRQAEVAQANHLKVIDGKIPLPDLRVEYETAQGEIARVDLELATHHYHGSHLREKVEAGFKMYGDAAATHRSPVFEEREITASILSL